MTFEPDIDQVRGWVLEGAGIAKHHFRNVTPEWKTGHSPVTVADRAVEQLLTERLRAAYPAHGIIGEEFGGDELTREYIWTVDPIDGTRSYVEGLPTWNITLALLHRRVPVFGLVYMPMTDDWTYTQGDDVLHNGVSVRDRLMTAWGRDSFVLARSDLLARYDMVFKRIMALGSSATHMALTAQGAALAMITYDSYVWDVAAGMAFLRLQGGGLFFHDGTPVDLAERDLTRKIEGLYIGGHAAVVPRLLPLITQRAALRTQPAWDSANNRHHQPHEQPRENRTS